MAEPIIYDLSAPGRSGVNLPAPDVPLATLPEELLRDDLPLPEVGELQVVRHFVRLSQLNYSIDTGLYPLGSCTMKYNPKINEDAARLPGLAHLHPLADPASCQGAMMLMHDLQNWLGEISGFEAVSLTPAAGAQGEFAGILMIRQYHIDRGEPERDIILVPDSAHGTNPATVTMAGLRVQQLPANAAGEVDLSALREACSGENAQHIAGMMLTMPSTLGLFEPNIEQVIDAVQSVGGLMYMDGANMNALMAVVKPGELGFDCMHYNLHKTFSTPHGGGGPGSGAVGVNAKLRDYLPGPIVRRKAEADDAATNDNGPGCRYDWRMPPKSIGRLKAFAGNFGMHLRAYAYIRAYGGEGLRQVTRCAVLNANYLRETLRGEYTLPYDETAAGERRYCGHEFVVRGAFDDAPDVHALDLSKRLIDYGFHPPTNYFPLIVPEALLIEPTETETKDDLDKLAEALRAIAQEAREAPQLLHDAPPTAPVRRLDEARAARQLHLCCPTARPSA
ncbi:MAG: glycine dehydrogenase subunit 2 [Chloroflexi bacterium]|nr:glycine dehydrogenase subunit 2 [Chloroflexota bacterium]